MTKATPPPKTLHCHLYTAQQTLVSDIFVRVSFSALDGVMTLLPGHAPLLTVLKKGLLYLHTADDDDSLIYNVGNGIAHITQDKLDLFTQEAFLNEDEAPAFKQDAPYVWV